MKTGLRTWVGLVAVIGVIFTLAACESTKHALGIGEPPPPPAPRYYDFPDVLVPPELDLDTKGSVVYEVGGDKGRSASLLRKGGSGVPVGVLPQIHAKRWLDPCEQRQVQQIASKLC